MLTLNSSHVNRSNLVQPLGSTLAAHVNRNNLVQSLSMALAAQVKKCIFLGKTEVGVSLSTITRSGFGLDFV